MRDIIAASLIGSVAVIGATFTNPTAQPVIAVIMLGAAIAAIYLLHLAGRRA
jgi:ABC-type cobalamin transport system permease subunit